MKIKSLKIGLRYKEFETKNYMETRKENNRQVIEEKNQFLKKVNGKEKIINYSYGDKYIIEYYSGHIEFSETKTEKGEMNLNLTIDQDFINTIISMSLDNACQIAEEQTRQFQEIFTSFVEKNCDSIERSSEKVKKGLLGRIVKQLK